MKKKKFIMTLKIRTSMGFAQFTDGNLSPFAGGVIEGLTDNAASFPALPVGLPALTTLKDTFDQALIDTADAGKAATAAKNIARAALIDALRKDAFYVAIAANNDSAVLLSSGYDAVSTNRAQSQLQQPDVVAVETPKSGELKVRVRRQANARAYEGRIKAAGSEFGPSISFASSKRLLFNGLTAGVKYTLQLCAVGGSTGRSDWSDPIEKMAV
jgi:hypothetical protein